MDAPRGADYYAVLGVPADAPLEAVERAYRERVKSVHPDRNDAPDAASEFARVREARAVLTDPEERARYDRLGHAAYTGVAGAADPGEGAPTPGPAGAGRSEPATRQRSASEEASDGRGSGTPGATASAASEAGPAWAAHTGSGATHTTNDSGDGTRRERSERTTTETGASTRYAVRTDHGLTRQLSWAGLTPRQAAIGVATFMVYPGLLVGAVTPEFTPVLNLFTSLFLLVVVVALLSMPRVGLVVFGAWLVVGPPVLVLTGVGVVSLAGVLFLLGNLLPFALALANFVASGGG